MRPSRFTPWAITRLQVVRFSKFFHQSNSTGLAHLFRLEFGKSVPWLARSGRMKIFCPRIFDTILSRRFGHLPIEQGLSNFSYRLSFVRPTNLATENWNRSTWKFCNFWEIAGFWKHFLRPELNFGARWLKISTNRVKCHRIKLVLVFCRWVTDLTRFRSVKFDKICHWNFLNYTGLHNFDRPFLNNGTMNLAATYNIGRAKFTLRNGHIRIKIDRAVQSLFTIHFLPFFQFFTFCA